MALRIPAHGLPSAEPRSVSGDLDVIVAGAPDARFARSGADLWYSETLGLADAVLGTTLTVSTLDGVASRSPYRPAHSRERCCACAARGCRCSAHAGAVISICASR